MDFDSEVVGILDKDWDRIPIEPLQSIMKVTKLGEFTVHENKTSYPSNFKKGDTFQVIQHISEGIYDILYKGCVEQVDDIY